MSDDADLELPRHCGGRAVGPDGSVSVHQTLLIRYQLLSDLQWRIPTQTITVEVFVFAGILASRGSLTGRLVFGILGFLVALVGAATMRRIELTARVDQGLLDVYESRMKPDETETGWPRGFHLMRIGPRVKLLARLQGEGPNDRPHGIFYGGTAPRPVRQVAEAFDRFVLLRFPPSLYWFGILVAIGVAALILAAIG